MQKNMSFINHTRPFPFYCQFDLRNFLNLKMVNISLHIDIQPTMTSRRAEGSPVYRIRGSSICEESEKQTHVGRPYSILTLRTSAQIIFGFASFVSTTVMRWTNVLKSSAVLSVPFYQSWLSTGVQSLDRDSESRNKRNGVIEKKPKGFNFFFSLAKKLRTNRTNHDMH